MKLGICCVYFYGADGPWLLPLQLRFISESLAGVDFTIYAAANRLDPALKAQLATSPHVNLIEFPHFQGDANHEHAFYLDHLIDYAIEDRCSHVAALDSDSFPIARDWPTILLREMGENARFAAVLRTENGDSHLPHPCGYFLKREFYLERQPSLFPDDSEIQSESFRSFITQTGQRIDTGIGYGYALWKSGERWLQLHRSNVSNTHFLMAGMYGDLIFHLGASSRRPSFHADYANRVSLRIARRMSGAPILWRLARRLEENYLMENQKTFHKIVTKLSTEPEKFIATLGNKTESTMTLSRGVPAVYVR